MSGHRARAIRQLGGDGKWAWDCAQCGDWSGYRYKTEEAAQRGATRHDEGARTADREVFLRIYGPRRQP
jgi:hypothetical protein